MQRSNQIRVVWVEKGKVSQWLAEQLGRDKSIISRQCINYSYYYDR